MKNALIAAVILLTLVLPQRDFSWAQSDMASQFLYEYAFKLYIRGSVEDAIHELKKSLMVNPRNLQARLLLRKLSPLALKISGPFVTSARQEERVCPGQEIALESGVPSLYGEHNFVYLWDFGDGNLLEGPQVVSHSYSKPGRYLVRLSVDEEGLSSYPLDLKQAWVNVNSPPLPDVRADSACCLGKENIFDASGSSDPDGDALSYRWDFGDGSFAEGPQVTHSYTRPGEYTVTLTLSDDSGTPCGSSSVCLPATVGANPVATIDFMRGD